MSARDQHRAAVTHEIARDIVIRVANALAPDLVMPIKGTLLARTYYDDVVERTMSDVDIVTTRGMFFDSLKRLASAGFTRTGWSSDLAVVTLVHADAPGLELDLHRFPLPLGFGRITSAWLAENASVDAELFGVPVLVPERTRLLAHTIGVVANDDVYRANRRSLEDIHRLAMDGEPTHDAATLRSAGLAIAARLVLQRVAEERPSSSAAAVDAALRLSPLENRVAALLGDVLRRAAANPSRPLHAKALSRFLPDTVALRFMSALAAAAGRAQGRLLTKRR